MKATSSPPEVAAFHPTPYVDWAAWVAAVDQATPAWSSSTRQLYELVAGIVAEGRAVELREVLRGLGSWETEALGIVIEWAPGGNQRTRPGRCRVEVAGY